MKKILAGIVGLLFVGATTFPAARALFTSEATVQGISITAGEASLQVYDGANYSSTWNTGLNLENVYPGFNDSTTIQLRNSSSSAVALAITGRLTSATNWPNLVNAVEVKVSLPDDSATTDWKTLFDWNAGNIPFPGVAIPQGTTQEYKVEVRVPTTYSSGPLVGTPVGNEINGLALSNIVITLTGTQTP